MTTGHILVVEPVEYCITKVLCAASTVRLESPEPFGGVESGPLQHYGADTLHRRPAVQPPHHFQVTLKRQR